MTSSEIGFIRAARLSELEQQGQLTVQVDGHTLALFQHQDRIYAVDNRCPHMGFPLDRGSVCDGILTCHWHHARFDLTSGGSFDLWADDVPAYAVEVRAGEIWVNLAPLGRCPWPTSANGWKSGWNRISRCCWASLSST